MICWVFTSATSNIQWVFSYTNPLCFLLRLMQHTSPSTTAAITTTAATPIAAITPGFSRLFVRLGPFIPELLVLSKSCAVVGAEGLLVGGTCLSTLTFPIIYKKTQKCFLDSLGPSNSACTVSGMNYFRNICLYGNLCQVCSNNLWRMLIGIFVS